MASRRAIRADDEAISNTSSTMTASEKIAAARAKQNEIDNDPQIEKKREVNLVKHTETIDRLVVQNKQLQRDLSEADAEVDELEKRLQDSNIRISKNLFYIFLGGLVFMMYIINGHLTAVSSKMVEMNVILQEYKTEIDKTKLYNDILEKKIGITKEAK